MKRLFLAASAVGMLMAAPAIAQMAPPPPPGGPMMGGPMMGGPMGGSYAGKSCVMNGAFVPCPPAGGMQPAMMDDRMGMRADPRMERDRPMTRREMREQRRMDRMERMQQRGM